jgi:hypothetical protein
LSAPFNRLNFVVMPKAKHFKAAAYVHSQLFAGLTSFAQLESRIAALPDEKTRGDAFEVFAEAYLATQRKHDAAHVWPHGSVPLPENCGNFLAGQPCQVQIWGHENL